MEFDNSMVFGGNSIFDGLLLGLQSLPAIVNCAYCKKDNLTAKKMAALISLEIYGSAKRLRGQL